MKKIWLSTLLALLCAPAARTEKPLEENINVEGTYIPDFITPDKFNILPQSVTTTIPVPEVEYETETAVADFAPALFPLPAWRGKGPDLPPGYVAFALGSRLDMGLQAGYRILDSDRESLSIRLSHLSTSLFRFTFPDGTKSHRRFSYDELLGGTYSRDLGRYGSLAASAGYSVRYFNYFTLPEAPTQTINDVNVSLDWKGTRENSWHPYAGLEFRHFAYRDFPLPSFSAEYPGVTANPGVPARESTLGAKGGFSRKAGPGSISLRANLDAAFLNIKGFDYGLLRLNPSYGFRTLGIDFETGFEVTAAVNDGLKGDRFPAVSIAPKIRMDARKERISGWLYLEGGSRLQTLAPEAALIPWAYPGALNTSSVRSPLWASLGMKMIPADGLEIRLQCDYRILKHLRVTGFYPLMLTLGGEEAMELVGLNSRTTNLHGFRALVGMKWNPSRWFGFEAEGTWQPQEGKNGWDNGFDRPRWTLDLKGTTNPWRTLTLGVGYSYRGVRGLWLRQEEGGLSRLKLPDLCDLGASATYAFSDRLTVGIDAVNLLNHHSEIQPGLPREGFSLIGRFQFLF